MSTTNHLGITLVQQSQAQKEVTVNQAFTLIDAILNTGAKSRSTSTPPGSPANGDVYIVGSSPTGAWSGQAGNIAWYNQTWNFLTPLEGATFWVHDESAVYTYNGTSWIMTARAINQPPVSLTDASSISWNLDTQPFATVTLAGNRTLANPSTLQPGNYTLIVKQDATGSRTLAYGSAFKFPSGTAPTLSTAASAIDMLAFVCDGTYIYGAAQKGFA
jgi:hypothetical protein